MRSHEILPEEIIDEFSDTDPGIIDHLETKGYEYIAAGVDQTAFLEPDGETVLKIFGTQDNAKAPKKKTDKPVFSADHMMFFRWAEYCNDHSSNPFLPKFSGFESFYWNGQVYLQIRQELMYPIETMLGYMLADMVNYTAAGDSFDEILDEISDEYNVVFQNLKEQVGMPGLKLLYKTIVEVDDISNKQGWTQDLHGDNFLSRTTDGRTPVIVDPWVVPDTSYR